MNRDSRDIWCFDGFVFDPAASELTRDGEPVAIEPQTVRLLDYLIRHRDRVVERGELIEAIWAGRAISDWAVSAAIKALRLALGDQGLDRKCVRTVHSRGYRFVAEVKTRQPSVPENTVQRLLVRLFRTSGDPDGAAYLAEGLTEDLITSLSRQSALNVMSYHAARALADQVPPPEAGIAAIVDGSVRQLGDTIRINVAVLDATGMDQIWAERFDLTRSSLIAGHDLISARLADVLAPDRPVLAESGHGTRNSEAYDTYLKGRYAYFRYEPAAFAEALAHFVRATELDPGFADAFAQQAYCRTTLFVFGLPGGDTTLDPAEALARRAIALNDHSALGNARLGWVLGYRGQPEATIAAFEAAIARDPDNAEVTLAYGETMNRLAQPDRAAPLIEAVFARDSYFPPSWEFARGHTAVLRGEQRSAIAHFRSVLRRVERFMPARVQLVRALWENGERAAAIAAVDEIRALAPRFGLAQAGRMFPYPPEAERARLIEALTGAGME